MQFLEMPDEFPATFFLGNELLLLDFWFTIVLPMNFIPLKTFENLRAAAFEFLLRHEAKCVSLVSRFLKSDSEIFLLLCNENRAADRIDESGSCSERIAGIISFSSGGQLLHCIQISKEEVAGFKNALSRLFIEENQFKKVFSVIGEDSAGKIITEEILRTLNRKKLHLQEYDLLEFHGKTEPAELKAEDLSGSLSVKTCWPSDFEILYPVQKAYELEEVVFSPEFFKESLSKLLLRQNLQKGLVYALYEKDCVVSKLSINAKGKNFVQIGGMYTMPEKRGNGMAQYLLEKICRKYSLAKKKLVLFVKKENEAAQKLYGKTGFQKICDYSILYFSEN